MAPQCLRTGKRAATPGTTMPPGASASDCPAFAYCDPPPSCQSSNPKNPWPTTETRRPRRKCGQSNLVSCASRNDGSECNSCGKFFYPCLLRVLRASVVNNPDQTPAAGFRRPGSPIDATGPGRRRPFARLAYYLTFADARHSCLGYEARYIMAQWQRALPGPARN